MKLAPASLEEGEETHPEPRPRGRHGRFGGWHRCAARTDRATWLGLGGLGFGLQSLLIRSVFRGRIEPACGCQLQLRQLHVGRGVLDRIRRAVFGLATGERNRAEIGQRLGALLALLRAVQRATLRPRPLAIGWAWRIRRSFARLRLRATVQISAFPDETYDTCTSGNISAAVSAPDCCACSYLFGSSGAGTPRTRGSRRSECLLGPSSCPSGRGRVIRPGAAHA